MQPGGAAKRVLAAVPELAFAAADLIGLSGRTRCASQPLEVADMAVRVLSLVWDGYPGGGSELLAMLALADWSDDSGRCYPSMAAIAKKVRLSKSQAQRVVHGLIDGGYVKVTANALGGSPTQTRNYRIVLDRLTGSAHATGSVDATGRTNAAEGSHPCGGRGSAHATQTVSEPSTTVKVDAQALSSSPRKLKTKEMTLAQFLDHCKASGEKAIPDNDPVMAYAEKVGISDDMLAVAWSEFKAAYLTVDKRYKDWRQSFRNAVRRNYYKLWFLAEGKRATWTTAGEQARRAAA